MSDYEESSSSRLTAVSPGSLNLPVDLGQVVEMTPQTNKTREEHVEVDEDFTDIDQELSHNGQYIYLNLYSSSKTNVYRIIPTSTDSRSAVKG